MPHLVPDLSCCQIESVSLKRFLKLKFPVPFFRKTAIYASLTFTSGILFFYMCKLLALLFVYYYLLQSLGRFVE